jgi:putative SOS response-associated peptidase YedK
MCYDIKANLEAQLKRAKRSNNEFAIREIEEKLKPYLDLPLNHVSGFDHPKMLIYPSESSFSPKVATWGLVPFWTKNEADKNLIWQKTLNAKAETLFEKPAFKEVAKNKRCLIYIEGFYEHHFHNGKAFPHFVKHKNEEPLVLAGIYDDWLNNVNHNMLKSFSIITTVGNELMTKIHNNPKLSGPRMPLVLDEELAEKWLSPNPKNIEAVLQYRPIENLVAYPVKPIKGKRASGNVSTASSPHYYPELEEIQGSLFD